MLLDECHHLASLWGYVVRAVLGELPPDVARDRPHRDAAGQPPRGRGRALRRAARPRRLHGPDARGRPRRPPRALPGARVPDRAAALRARLAGRARHPLPRADHDPARRHRVPAVGHPAAPRPHALAPTTRPSCSWAEFQKRSPKLARAGVRFLLSGEPAAPDRRPARRGLPPAARPRRLARPARGLRAALPRPAVHAQGRRPLRRDRRRAARARLPAHPQGHPPRHVRGRPPADRLPGEGARARRRALRRARDAAATRCARSCSATPSSRPSAPTTRSPASSIPPPAPPATRCWRSPPTTAPRHLRPLLVSGRGLRCSPHDADVLLEALQATAEDHFKLTEWEARASTACWSRSSPAARSGCRARGSSSPRGCSSRARPACLVGTRALLGEGWNCPPLNVLVDMTIATTGVSVQQMRGRSLRLDPADPEKVASNWDVVCVAPDLVRGSADYERFVRKHLNLFAPAEDGEVEAGPSPRPPGARPVRPAAGRALPRAQPRAARARRRPRRGPRALADRHALPRRRAPDPAGARPRPAARRRRPRPRAAHAPSLPEGPDRAPASAAARVRRARRRRRRAAAARRPRARARRASAGPPCGCARAKQRLPLILPLDAAARTVIEAYQRARRDAPTRPPARSRSSRAPPATCAVELTPGHARGGQEVRRRARRARERLRQPALPRVPAARGPAPRRARPARARAHPPAPVRRAPAPRPRRPRAQQGARRGLRARLAPARRPGPAGVHPAHRARAARRAPWRLQPTAATRRWSGTSGSEPARPGPRPRGPGRRGRRRRRRAERSRRQSASAPRASSAASRQASSTGLHSGSRRRTISSVSGTSSRRLLRSAWLIVAGRGFPHSRWTTPPTTHDASSGCHSDSYTRISRTGRDVRELGLGGVGAVLGGAVDGVRVSARCRRTRLRTRGSPRRARHSTARTPLRGDRTCSRAPFPRTRALKHHLRRRSRSVRETVPTPARRSSPAPARDRAAAPPSGRRGRTGRHAFSAADNSHSPRQVNATIRISMTTCERVAARAQP